HDYIIDYKIINKYYEQKKPMIDVLLAALPKQNLARIWSLCQYIGFEPKIIDLSIDCLTRLYSTLAARNNLSGNMAIVNLSENRVEFIFLDQGVFFLYSDLKINLKAIASCLAKPTAGLEAKKELADGWLPAGKLLNRIPVQDQVESDSDEVKPDLAEVGSHQIKCNNLDDLTLNDDSFWREVAATILTKERSAKEEIFTVASEPHSSKDKGESEQTALINNNRPMAVSKEFLLEDLYIPKEKVPCLQLAETDLGKSQEIDDCQQWRSEDVSARVNNSFQQAESLLNPLVSVLAELLDSYADSHYGNKVGNIYLTGEYCLLPHLPEIISRKLGIDSVVGFPGWEPKVKAKDEKFNLDWPKYGCLYGLALRED
ncbi:MAG: hypothetical protein GX091_02415, partial [Peptococcaceae bacterium]|nr:hypothetical protein [Peptococcaceae bacterium]